MAFACLSLLCWQVDLFSSDRSLHTEKTAELSETVLLFETKLRGCFGGRESLHHERFDSVNVPKETVEEVGVDLTVAVGLSTRKRSQSFGKPWSTTPSLPVPDVNHPKKETLSPTRTRHCRHPHPQHTPEQTREKTPIIRSRAKLRLSMLIRLIDFFRHDSNTSVSSARPHLIGVGRGQPLTDPSPDTIPRICSPFPTLEASCPPPFKFAQIHCFFFPVRT